MKKFIVTPIGIGIVLVIVVVFGVFFGEVSVDSKSDVKMFDVPKDLKSVTISGTLKPYDIPANAPQSSTEPEFVLVPDKNYPEVNGAITIALYNLMQIPENPEHVQITGFFNPNSPDWYYPEQTQRTQQVIFVEKIIQIKPIDLGNKFTTQELRSQYDKIQEEYQSQKSKYLTNEITEEQYLSNLNELNKSELELYENVKNHTFQRDEMTEYNFWYRGVMKFPTSIEQEISKITQ